MNCQVVHEDSQRNTRILESDVLYEFDEISVLPSSIENLDTFQAISLIDASADRIIASIDFFLVNLDINFLRTPFSRLNCQFSKVDLV